MGDNNHDSEMLSAAAGEASPPPAAADRPELGATADQFEELAAELTETLVQRDEQVEELRNEVARLELVAGARQGEIARLDWKLRELRKSYEKVELDCWNLAETVRERDRRIAELEAELKRAQLGFRETFSRSASAADGRWF